MVSQEPVYRDVCGKCGATRQDEQIGLEKTPEEYVAKLVEVFREMTQRVECTELSDWPQEWVVQLCIAQRRYLGIPPMPSSGVC